MHNNARLRFIVIGGVTVALLCILVFSGKRQKQAHYLQRLAELTNALNAAFQNTTRFSRDDLEAGTNLQIQLQEFAGDGYFGELLKAGIIYGQYATQLLAKGTFHFHEGGKRDEEAFKQEVIKEIAKKDPEIAEFIRKGGLGGKSVENAEIWFDEQWRKLDSGFTSGNAFAKLMARKVQGGPFQILPRVVEQNTGTLALAVLNLKGLLIERESALRRTLDLSDDPTIVRLKQHINDSHQARETTVQSLNLNTVKARTGEMHERIAAFYAIKNGFLTLQQQNDSERGLRKHVIQMAKHDRWKPLPVMDIRRALPQDKAIVEFLRYGRESNEDGEVQVLYGAMVFERNTAPRWISLGPAAEIDGLIADFNRVFRYSEETAPSDTAVKALLQRLYQKLWHPLHLVISPGVKTVHVSPDGQIHLLSLAALWNGTSFAGENLDFVTVNSSRSFVASSKGFVTSRKTIEAFVNPSFAVNNGGQNQEVNIPSKAGSMKATRLKFDPLEGTEKDARGLTNFANEANGYSVQVHSRTNATEKALRSVESPRILILSTHGFTMPSAEPNKKNIGLGKAAAMQSGEMDFEDPFQRCGLAFAGANETIKNWSPQQVPGPADDGILTASEAAGLDLSGNWLTVLAACDTGVGAIAEGESVLCLKMGFIQAGARNLMYTLWRLDDVYTSDFIQRFVQASVESGDPARSLARLQAAELVNLSRAARPHSFWNAVKKAGPFVLNSSVPSEPPVY